MRKIVSIVSSSAAKCIVSFPCPLLLSLHQDYGVGPHEFGQPLSADSISISSAIRFQAPCGLLSSIEDHFFSEPGPINDHCPKPNFSANMETTLAFAKHSSYRCWVHFRGDSCKKNSNKILASPKKSKNNFSFFFGFVEIHLLSFYSRKVDNACVRSVPDWHRIGTNLVRTNPINFVIFNFFWS